MSSIILLFLCLVIGIVLQFVKSTARNTHTVLNQFVINISLPAMALFYIPKLQLSGELLLPVLMPWLSILLACIIFISLGKIFGWSRALTGCLIMTTGFGNTSFVGIPVIQALYGAEGLETLMMIDLPGTFVALSTIGIFIASVYSKGETNWKKILKRMFSFIPFIAFIIAMLLNIMGLRIPEMADEALGKIAATVSPLALVSVGFQLRIERKSPYWRFLVLGLFYQLILFPAIIFIGYKLILKKEGMMIDVCVIEAAMAPMITACLVAAAHGLKPKLCNMMVGVGIPVSFITIALWYWLLQ